MDDFRQLQEENGSLKRAVEELSILNELATAIGAVVDSEAIIRKIISRSLKAVNAEQGTITLVDDQPSQPMKTLIRTMASSADHDQFHFDQALLGWMNLNKKPLMVNSPATDERFRGVPWNESIKSVLCVPMLVRSALKGVLSVYNKKGGNGFTQDDQRLLAIIAAQSAQIVENARLYEEERSLIKMQQELKLASQIQADLLPKGSPQLEGYEIAGATFPARTIGGDYFDFIPVEDTKVALCLGDVSGKGLTAALLMANLQASLRAQTYLSASVEGCVSRVNRQLYQSTSPEKFATLFFGILDTSDHSLTYCNAGHEPPIMIRRNGEMLRLKDGGTVVGITDDFQFEDSSVCFQPGDVLVIFSDGVTEAMSSEREQFGENTLTELLRTSTVSAADKIVEKIVTAVRKHAGDAPQHDDITAVVVRREMVSGDSQ